MEREKNLVKGSFGGNGKELDKGLFWQEGKRTW